MSKDSEAPSRLEKLDRAVSREMEHRRRALRFYWLLLLIPVVIAAWILYSFGLHVDKTTAENVDTRIGEEFDTRIDEEIDTRIDKKVPQAVRQATQESAFKEQVSGLLESSLLLRIEEITKAELGSQRERIDDNRFAIKLLEDKLNALPDIPSPCELDDLRNDLAKISEEMKTLIEELAVLRRQQSEFDDRLRRLEVGTGEIPRSYLLKANRESDLYELGWTIGLGRRTDRGVESVEIRRGSQTVHKGGETIFGTPFSFTVRPPECKPECATTYEVTLGYALSRKLSPDYVGMEIVTLRDEPQPEP